MRLTRRAFTALAGLAAAQAPVSSQAQAQAPAPAPARTLRALLVGVTEYPGLPPERQLRGPRNDIERMHGLLRRRGFADADVVVLADGVAASRALPTRGAILQALDRLAADSRPGDFALLHFCGHGSQRPVPAGAPDADQEPDGQYEVFLPRDVAPLVPGSGDLRSTDKTIADHEFRQRADALAGRGVFVWAVFDTCHSASMVRGGADPQLRYRHVPPEVLGYGAHAPAAASAGRRAAPSPAAAEPPRKAQAVYFYASQTAEKALELPLPQGGFLGLGRKPHGAFSLALVQTLEQAVPMSYRQLAQQILVNFAALNLQPDVTLSDRQKPAFGGTALDAPVFQQATGLSPPQWAIVEADATGARVLGGALNRLAGGALLAIVGSPVARAQDVLGYARVVAVGLADCRVQWIAHQGRPLLAGPALPPGSHARLERPGADYALRVFVELDPAVEAARAPAVRLAVQRLKGEGVAGVAAVWSPDPADADVVLRVEPGRARVLPRSLARAPGLQARDGLAEMPFREDASGPPDADTVAQRIAEGLHRVARATNLFRMALMAAGLPAAAALGLQPRLMLQRRGAAAGSAEPLTPEATPVLHDGDRIDIAIANTGPLPLDVNLLYIDARFGITCWPGRGRAPTIEAGGTLRVPKPLTIHADPAQRHAHGQERLLVVGMRQHALKEDNSLAFLQQEGLDAVRSAAADAGEAQSEDLRAFADAGFARHLTRAGGGGPPTPPAAGTVLLVYTFNVRPGRSGT